MEMGIYDDSTRHKSSSINNQKALKIHSVSNLSSPAKLSNWVIWKPEIGLIIITKLGNKCK